MMREGQGGGSFIWKKWDGYHEKHQYINRDTGEIVGEVHGSQFNPDDGWTAHRRHAGNFVHLGTYVGAKKAKLIVEAEMRRKRKAVA